MNMDPPCDVDGISRKRCQTGSMNTIGASSTEQILPVTVHRSCAHTVNSFSKKEIHCPIKRRALSTKKHLHRYQGGCYLEVIIPVAEAKTFAQIEIACFSLLW